MPESPHALLVDLENIERVMLECYGEKQRLKDKAATACPEKGTPNKGSSKDGSSIQVPKKVKVKKFCQKCKTYDVAHQTHNTNKCAAAIGAL
jgi:hypothetical protein